MESVIGRRLTDRERVHHIDLVKGNNDPENLFLFPGPREHRLCHNSLNAIVRDTEKVPELLRMGKLHFDRTEGVYK
ncbi:HNH endonuclease [Faecalibaculum rodentium]|uniref:HNH endonuclease n=1 Tax=Faecalibaculum rodentium TaxID=1702221 RepID=UPI0034E4E57F